MSVSAIDKKPYTLDFSLSNQVSMAWGLDPVIRVKILRENDGKLMCRHCSGYWCKHIETLIVHGDDAPLMFAEECEPHGSKIVIPMAPRFDLYAEVRCGVYHPSADSYQLFLVDDNKPMKNQLLDLQFMGFFNPHHGEGRAVVRLMIRDWITANYTAEPNCKITAHNYASQQKMKANLADPDMHFPEWFCLWRTRSCLECYKAMTDFTDDGLVPF